MAPALELAFGLLNPGGDVSLLSWQRYVAEVSLRIRPSGQWVHDEIGIVLSRQNGKTQGFAEPRILGGLLALDDRIAHAAQDRELPRRTFLRLAEILEDPPLSRLVRRIAYGSGKEAIDMRGGGMYRLLSSRPASTRGLEAISLVVIDEFLEARDYRMLQAILPTQLMAKRRQTLYLTTAGHAWSVPLHDLRKRALEPDARDGLAYLEWSTDPGTDPDDPSQWGRANPALGEALTLEALEQLRARVPEAVWRQEQLGQFVHVVAAHAFDLDAWERATVPELPAPAGAPVSVGVVLDPSGRHGAAVASWPIGAGRHALELIAYPTGSPLIDVAGFADTVAGFVRDHPSRLPVSFDPWTTRDVADRLEAQGIPTEPVTGREWVNACGHLVAEVAAGRVAHLGRDTLSGQIEATGRHESTEGRWWFSAGEVPVPAVFAATRALWVATRPAPTLHVF
jgi:hypothetical protein